MHDLRFAEDAVSMIRKKLKDTPSARLKAINVALSPASHVTPKSLNGAFQQALASNELKGIELKVRIPDILIICKDCKNEFTAKKPVLNCPRCNSAELEVKLPDEEFYIESLELDK